MALTIIGLLIALLPFAAVVGFNSKLNGVATIFAVSAAFHLLVATLTQSAHVFSYPLVLSLHLAAGAAWLVFAAKARQKSPEVRFDWFVASAFGLVLLFFVSLHYGYTGTVARVVGTEFVTQSSYPYPMYSDEWVAVSLIGHSIESGSLPMVNPLSHGAPFNNLLAGFHSLVAEVMLLLHLDPLTQYAWLAIVNGALVCLLVYLVLRLCGVSLYAAAISTMAVPLITNSGNLPGVWYLLPFSLSLTFLLLGFVGFLLRRRLVLALGFAIALVVYPPIAVFVAPALVGIFVRNRAGSGEKLPDLARWILWALAGAAALTVLVVGQSSLGFGGASARALSLVARERLSGGIVSFGICSVLPVFILPFAAFGLWDLFKGKRHFILLPAVTGLAFWVAYNWLLLDFVIGQSKAVYATALFLVIAAGFGIDWLYRTVRERYRHVSRHVRLTSLKISTLLVFTVAAVLCAQVGLWRNLTLSVEGGGGARARIPAPPITRYLSDEDLALFAGIEGKNFIAPPWKGLVIGVATGNYPLDSKSSTVTNKILGYNAFVSASCAQKEAYAEKFKIDFAYATPFSCAAFAEVGQSGEGLVLYEVKR